MAIDVLSAPPAPTTAQGRRPAPPVQAHHVLPGFGPVSYTHLPARSTRRIAGAAGLAAALLFAAAPAHAQDKATLDLLVKKNVITQEEADTVAKSASIPVTPKEAAVKKLTLEGVIQLQYDWLTTKDKTPNAVQPPATSQFYIRRAYLGALADLGNGWSGELLLDFAAGAKPPAAPQGTTDTGTQNYFEKVVINKKFDDYGIGCLLYTSRCV